MQLWFSTARKLGKFFYMKKFFEKNDAPLKNGASNEL
jgi:hypothetical protein